MHVHLARLTVGAPIGLGSEGKALEHAEAALAILEPGPDTVDKALLYQLMARLNIHKDEPATSVVWAQKAIGLFGKLDMFMGTSLGTSQARIGEIDKGIEYQENNWEPTLQGGNALAIFFCGDDIILTHTMVRNIPRALEWGEKVLLEVTKIGDLGLGLINVTLVLTYTLSGQISKAMEAWSICRKQPGTKISRHPAFSRIRLAQDFSISAWGSGTRPRRVSEMGSVG